MSATSSVAPNENWRSRLLAGNTQSIKRQRFRALSLGRARDPQLLHLVDQGCPLEAQASCRSTSTSDDPIAFAKRSQNLFSLGLLQHIPPAARAESYVTKHCIQWHSHG